MNETRKITRKFLACREMWKYEFDSDLFRKYILHTIGDPNYKSTSVYNLNYKNNINNF
jgi:hypothetical protein